MNVTQASAFQRRIRGLIDDAQHMQSQHVTWIAVLFFAAGGRGLGAGHLPNAANRHQTRVVPVTSLFSQGKTNSGVQTSGALAGQQLRVEPLFSSLDIAFMVSSAVISSADSS